MKKPKVVLIGIDGGEFRILKTMIDKNRMPNLEKIIEHGVVADIDGYVKGPGQGWASLMTGQPPDQHGIFYWSLYDKTINSRSFRQPLLWEILGQHNIKSCIVNLSYTYPPKPFNGYMISGGGSLVNSELMHTISYPKTLIDEINRKIGCYIVDCKYQDGSIERHMRLIDDLIEMTRIRTDACLYIMEKYSPEFVFPVFRGADLIQHCYWNLICSVRSVKTKYLPLMRKIEEYYEQLDNSIFNLFEKYEGSYNFIISDHGFCANKAIVNINNYLEVCGFLKRSNPCQKEVEAHSSMFEASVRFYRQYLEKHKVFYWLNAIRKKFVTESSIPPILDTNETLAYSDVLNGIKLNYESVPKSQALEIKKRIIESLNNLNDPLNGKNVITKAYLKEQSYASNLKDAPDIIYEHRDDYFVTFELTDNSGTIFKYMDKEPVKFFNGIHKKNGVFISEKDHELFQRNNLKITDAFYLVLALFNVEIKAP